jgi:hypothetical protein
MNLFPTNLFRSIELIIDLGLNLEDRNEEDTIDKFINNGYKVYELSKKKVGTMDLYLNTLLILPRNAQEPNLQWSIDTIKKKYKWCRIIGFIHGYERRGYFYSGLQHLIDHLRGEKVKAAPIYANEVFVELE